MRRFVVIGFVVAIAVSIRYATVDGQEKKAGKDTLESLQADGLKNNHDVKVFEAKVRLAEAELARVRANLQAEIGKAYRELQVAIIVEKESQIRLQRAELAFKNKVIAHEDFGSAVLTHAKFRSERVTAEERLKILVGRPIGEIAEPKMN
jgi:hypothetical protein